MTFSERLFEELEKQGKKKIDLANFLGVNKSIVSAWDVRNSTPAVDVAYKVAQFLGVSVEYLVTGKNANIDPYDLYLQKIKATVLKLDTGDKVKIAEIIEIFPKLNNEQKTVILDMLKALANYQIK
ncbi:helix-turn-helix domain-containing protein [Treponema pectinovorum]|uniref:helix-turn-helix domain-containing protein n=1 Tax=Treponema pectinovorum TaxID=164 RepID=UPI0011CB3F0D|nr:helix-turn-helix domain-containing protein [Treponema pectinovorum]